jgi:ABC-type sugar transport system ATPase subunit
MAGVVFDGVTKTFGDAIAVDDLHLRIDDGEFLVLLGPSGCGKSTALRLIAGLDEPTAGTIRIDDVVVNGVDPKARDLAMVFQSYALYPNMSVRKNIGFPLRPRRVPRAQIDRAVREVAAMLGLSELLDRKPGQLSGGQRQRVALARAIVREPQVFLMDEPLSNLDAKMRTQTRGDLVQLHARLGTTFVYVTHDQAEAMTMATRVAVLREGRLQQLGAPQAIYDRPANVFVARFLGSPPMNVLPGVLEGGSLAVGGVRLPAPPAFRTTAGVRRVDVGIRPEHLLVTGAGSDHALPARVELVETLGHERLVRCAVDGGLLVVRCPVDGAVPDHLSLAVDPAHIHLFDADSGERLDG